MNNDKYETRASKNKFTAEHNKQISDTIESAKWISWTGRPRSFYRTTESSYNVFIDTHSAAFFSTSSSYSATDRPTIYQLHAGDLPREPFDTTNRSYFLLLHNKCINGLWLHHQPTEERTNDKDCLRFDYNEKRGWRWKLFCSDLENGDAAERVLVPLNASPASNIG